MDILNDTTIQTLIWFFLVAFLLHDLEEIILVEPWIKKNKNKVISKIPERLHSRLDKLLNITSSKFTVAVLLEFIIFIPFTFIAAEQGKYFVFLSFNTLFFLHVFTHLGQSLYLKMYTPGVVSAIFITLPYSIYLFYRMIAEQLVTWDQILLSIPLGIIIIPVILIGHEFGRKVVP